MSKFIVFEGLDKSGKDTQAEKFVDFLNSRGIKTFFTYEPTNSNIFGKLIHYILKHRIRIPQVLFQKMYYWDRLIHVREIKKHLKKDEWVISSRYFFSTIAFGYALGIDVNKILKWHEKILRPDKVLFIDISAEEAIERLKKEGKKAEFFEKLERLKKARNGYMKCFELFPDIFRNIGGDRSREEVFEDVKKTMGF